jgi:hypothetical protein
MVIDARSIDIGQLTAKLLQQTRFFTGSQCNQCAVLDRKRSCTFVGSFFTLRSRGLIIRIARSPGASIQATPFQPGASIGFLDPCAYGVPYLSSSGDC